MAGRTEVPVLLLTGFLGSGKTSLLKRWLRAPEFAGAMAIVNELGEVGIDDRLVEMSSEATLLLENGCLCCAAGEDLTATLERLFWDRLHRKIPPFSWVLIETSGLADPAPIVARLRAHSVVSQRYRVAGVVTTFDAALGPAQLSRHPECVNQLANADAIILTKTDLANPGQIAAARSAIALARPNAVLLPSSREGVLAATLLALLPPEGAQQQHEIRDGASRPPATHSPAVTSAFLALAEAVDVAALQAALRQTQARFSGSLLRLKGLVRRNTDGLLVAVQAVASGEIEISPLADDAAAPTRAGLTFIAQFVTARTLADFAAAKLAEPNLHAPSRRIA